MLQSDYLLYVTGDCVYRILWHKEVEHGEKGQSSDKGKHMLLFISFTVQKSFTKIFIVPRKLYKFPQRATLCAARAHLAPLTLVCFT